MNTKQHENKSKNFYFFIGTTAELIKISPVIKEFKKRKIPLKLITTGQNIIKFDELEMFSGKIKPAISFSEKYPKSSVIKFIFWTMRTFFTGFSLLRKEFNAVKRDQTYFIVHGDTVSSLIGAVLAKIYGLQLVHIESGLRSFSFLEPFPEELCRFFVSRIATIHFCPNEWAVKNIAQYSGKKINTRQNTLLEIFSMAIKKKMKIKQKIVGKYFVLVIHRQEHVVFGTHRTKAILNTILQNIPKGFSCVLIMHELTASFIYSLDPELVKEIDKRIIKISRLPYAEFMHLIQGAEFLITDGGSNQEEAYYMGKPTLLLRNVTERIEGLGENVVLSKGNESVIKEFIRNYKKYKRKRVLMKERPSKIIVDYLLEHETK